MRESSNKLPTEYPLSEFLRFYGRRLKVFFAVVIGDCVLVGLAYLFVKSLWLGLVLSLFMVVGLVYVARQRLANALSSQQRYLLKNPWARGNRGQILEELKSCFWRMRSVIYVWWWGLSPIKKAILKLSVTVLGLTIIFLFINPLIATWVRPEIFKWFESRGGWILLILTSIVFVHRWYKWLTEKETLHFIESIHSVALDGLEAITIAPESDKQWALDDFIVRVLIVAHNTLHEKLKIRVNVMLPDSKGHLKIAYLYPVGTPYDPDLAFEPGYEIAGISYSETNIVYTPYTKQRYGIKFTLPESEGSKAGTAELVSITSVSECDQKNFEYPASILSIPIIGPSRTYGVLNFDSRKKSVFTSYDTHIAATYARVLGVAMSLVVVNR